MRMTFALLTASTASERLRARRLSSCRSGGAKITGSPLFSVGKSEVLQLYRPAVIGWPDAPPGVFGLRSIQMASIRAGGHPHGSGMVFALLAFVPRRRGAIGRAWALGGSRHRLALGPAVRPGVGSAPAQTG